jgi:hypothetical protein
MAISLIISTQGFAKTGLTWLPITHASVCLHAPVRQIPCYLFYELLQIFKGTLTYYTSLSQCLLLRAVKDCLACDVLPNLFSLFL